MSFVYELNPTISAQEFCAILVSSTLGERRPIHDLERLASMLRNADIIITARKEGRLVGIARAITDFSYCCYLSDLAIDAEFQHQGIGKRLIEETHKAAGEQTSLILLSAPAAQAYYPKIGMQPITNGWMFAHKV